MEYNKEQYFATLDEDQLAQALFDKVIDYFDIVRSNGMLKLWKKSYNAYYKSIATGGKIRATGEQGEFSNINVNHYKSLLQHRISLTIKDRPAFEPRATNSDYKSQAQTILARGLLDYYLREKRLEKVLKRAVDFALRYGEGYVRAEWDASMGDTYATDPETGEQVKEGDILYEAFSPIDIIRDTTKENPSQNDWYIIRTFKNRFDLIAKYASIEDTDEDVDEDVLRELEELKAQILALPSKTEIGRDGSIIGRDIQETDDIPVYEFYHKKTPSVPDGKYSLFLDAETILYDGSLPYDDIPVYSMFGSEIDGTPFGYSVAFDLLALQEAVDGLHSAVVTNQKTFAVQLVALPKGSSITSGELGQGLSVLFYQAQNVPGGGKPEAVNLTATPAEVFNYIEKLERLMETISGINSVTRGNPEASLKSGAALALVQSMAIEFATGMQQSYVALLEDVGTATINILKEYANTARVASISGKANRSMMKEFTGDDLSEINRVTVDVGSALARTTAGKLSILENLIQAGLIKSAEQYMQVLQTGNLDPAIEGESAELMLIRSENERLSAGHGDVVAVATDAHSTHIHEHKTVLASPEARENPEIVNSTLMHIQSHIELLTNTDPNLLALLGQQSLVPAQQGMPPAGGEMAAPEGMDVMSPQDPLAQQVDAIQEAEMPTMPINPLSGQEFNPETGGL